jgi:23S rRNA (adenine2030-N6)-methyltransferase
MLSYQHIYHAGNLADVHKHSLLSWMLAYMTRKDKPMSFWESHAGRGLYHLDAAESLKTGEAAQGILRTTDWFAPDHPYRAILDRVRADHGTMAYPGSPLIAALSLRDIDRLQLTELHPQEFAALQDVMLPYPAHCQLRDGMQMALSQLPPDPKRGMLLVDPSFEVKTDYQTIPEALIRIHRKWPVGVLVLWYPILASKAHLPMLDRLETALAGGFRHEVRFPPAREGHGMTGSGLFVVNPPFGLQAEAAALSARFADLAPQ